MEYRDPFATQNYATAEAVSFDGRSARERDTVFNEEDDRWARG